MGRAVCVAGAGAERDRVKFTPLPIPGAYLVEIEPMADERGFFARTFCADEFRRRGLNPAIAQCSLSWNKHKGTLRGMHYQIAPHAEAKLVSCPRGAIHDVIVDLRPESPSFRRWTGADLTAENRCMIYVPEGCAHGFQTLVDGSEVYYQISAPHAPGAARGVRWNDPAFGIAWPDSGCPILSERDRTYPDFAP